MRKPLMAGNWKLNKTISESLSFVNALKTAVSDIKDVDILICPTFVSINAVYNEVKNSNINVGAQDLFWEEKGAFTGEISTSLLKDAGCAYVLIGHSERRQYFGETNETVNKKIKAALSNEIVPIVCVGETLKEREENITFQVIEKQIKEALSGLGQEEVAKLVIAYEPVWAIGTGKTATPEQSQEVHSFIRKECSQIYKDVADTIRILYGGSVKPDNVAELMKQPDIDGGLVGGASLEVESFIKLINYSKS
ncbi:MAG: triose-phosphate isomerase [Endomicrobium sp.]|jgi:triosephosphate isomerase|nr:triose-phosphate isomerase [Endomicrobium sp.]